MPQHIPSTTNKKNNQVCVLFLLLLCSETQQNQFLIFNTAPEEKHSVSEYIADSVWWKGK
jgi:hypothetical protein